MNNDRVNMHLRMPLKSLEALAELFKDNPYRHTVEEISEKSGIAKRTIRELLLVHARRPDLAQEVFNDQLSLYQAGKMMRAEPAKWKPKRRSRTSQVAFDPSSGADNDLLPRVRRLEIELRELIDALVAQKVYQPPGKNNHRKRSQTT
jgi:hypothetical protein